MTDIPPNPYAPYAPPAEAPAPPRTLYRPLYTANQVALATFLGTPVAGAILMAVNERRLGTPARALPTIAVSVVVVGAFVGLASVLPDSVPTAPLNIGLVVGTRYVAHLRQHEALDAYFAAGGKRGSSWAAAGVGFVGLIVAMLLVVLVVLWP